MKKLVFVVALFSAAMVPASGLAGVPVPDYGGKVEGDPNHYLGFQLKKQNGQRKVKNAFVLNAPLACADANEDGRDSGGLDGTFKVDDEGRFGGTRRVQFTARRGDFTGIKFTLRGKIKPGGKASGIYRLRLFGETTCYTGEMRWRAKKPAAPFPPSRSVW